MCILNIYSHFSASIQHFLYVTYQSTAKIQYVDGNQGLNKIGCWIYD